MEQLELKLENIKLHNRISKLNQKQADIKEQVYINIKEASKKINKIQDENINLKNENVELKKQLEKVLEEYNQIPSIIRKVFSRKRS